MSENPTDPRYSEPSDLDREEFALLFSRYARVFRRIYRDAGFNHHDAEEVFQNTSVVLWNKFGEFSAGSNFFAWASRVAYFEVLSLMKQRPAAACALLVIMPWICSQTRRSLSRRLHRNVSKR